MEKLKPKLFSVMKTYTKEQFVKDVIAGIIVAIIALPLSIALALASGVKMCIRDRVRPFMTYQNTNLHSNPGCGCGKN